MVRSRITRLVALTAGLAVMVPTAAAQAGGGAPAVDPPIVGVPIVAHADRARQRRRRHRRRQRRSGGRPAEGLTPVPDPVLQGRQVPDRQRPAASRGRRQRQPAALPQAGTAHRPCIADRRSSGWIRARSSGAEGAGPAFADGPTAVFDVFTSQFSAATAAVGMAPDVKGTLLTRVQTTLNTAVVLRNRLVKIIHAAEPPAPPVEDGRVHARASGAPVAATFGS